MYCCILKQSRVGLIFMMFYYTLKIELLLGYVRDKGEEEWYMNLPSLFFASSRLMTRNQNPSFLPPASACVMATDCNMIKVHCKITTVELTLNQTAISFIPNLICRINFYSHLVTDM